MELVECGVRVMQAVIENRSHCLDNFRDESVMEYKHLRQKQVSREMEARIEQQVASKLSSVDEVLRKATLA